LDFEFYAIMLKIAGPGSWVWNIRILLGNGCFCR
jgi:hypothetical protein